eukprot:COSAG01_NODE_41245_length_453_cov_2541.324859_1_plen_39_part_10
MGECRHAIEYNVPHTLDEISTGETQFYSDSTRSIAVALC